MRRISRFHQFAMLVVLCMVLIGGPTASAATPSLLNSPQNINEPLSIPQVATTPKVDGVCDRQEYLNVTPLAFTDAFGSGEVFLMHDGSALYVCMQTAGSQFSRTFASIYLDKGAKRADIATDSDYSLVRPRDPASPQRALRGSGVPNGYVEPGPTGWDSAVSSAAGPENYEYRIPIDIFGGKCGDLFGIAAYHLWVTAVGDDYGWPSNQFFDQPKTWQLAKLAGLSCTPNDRLKGKIAYVFRNNTADAANFKGLLDPQGFTTTLIPLASVLATDFSQFDLIIIADDTGDLDDWGLGTATQKADQILKITRPNKPILGVGEGGYAFFGRLSLFIGWPNGWHGPAQQIIPTAEAPSYYTTPYAVPGITLTTYSTFVNEVGIYLEDRPGDATVFALERADQRHAPQIAQGCRQLWGFSEDPSLMTAAGKNLFTNAVVYGLNTACRQEPTPPVQTECKLTLTKTAVPPDGTTVRPGDTIMYTLSYTLTGDNSSGEQPGCRAYRARLVDPVPADTILVPGSAGDATLTPDKLLTWDLGTLEPDPTTKIVTGSRSFKVIVSEVMCVHQSKVFNQARLTSATMGTVVSNAVIHPVECPPVQFPNEKPPYAQDEIQIHPYPLTTGVPSNVSVRVTNHSAVTQILTVRFQVSPDRFGIGMEFGDFHTETVSVPAFTSVIVNATFTPATPGHYCMQVVVEGKDVTGKAFAPISTQRNLDVSEDFTDGQDTMTFKVHNPFSTDKTMILVVDNTCPGWTAVLDQTSVALGPNETKEVNLLVTPPNPVVLGSKCHIDVQGWIDGKLIGGVRKIDAPPVGLPTDVIPSWLEPEISVTPNPPVVGLPAKLCVELQNPLPVARTVTIVYSVADFGAGIPFTEVATKTFTLPPNSPPAKYCADWTPATGGTLHRCVLVTLKQDGYHDQHSQRNLNVVRLRLGESLTGKSVDFKIGNPNNLEATLAFDITRFGIDPFWNPVIEEVLGDGSVRPAPASLGPNEVRNFRLTLRPAAGLTNGVGIAQAEPAQPMFGDTSLVDVGVSLNDEPISGFSVQFTPPVQVFLPTIVK